MVQPEFALLACLLVGAAPLRGDEPVPTGGSEFTEIFNGRDLSGWDGQAGFWTVQGGAITGETTLDRPLEHHSYLIYRDAMPADFELQLQFRIASGNSGVQYRSVDLGDFDVRGYQCNIRTAVAGHTGILEEMKNGRGGALAEVGQQVRIEQDGRRVIVAMLGDPQRIEKSIDRRGWNRLSIVARGDRLIHRINGQVIVDVTDQQRDKSAERGVIALQLHTGRPMKVQFREIRLRME